jgi:hypothetical protein
MTAQQRPREWNMRVSDVSGMYNGIKVYGRSWVEY